MSNHSSKIYAFKINETKEALEKFKRLYSTGEECEWCFIDDRGFKKLTRGYVCSLAYNSIFMTVLVKTIYGFGGAHGGEMQKIVMPAGSYQGSGK